MMMMMIIIITISIIIIIIIIIVIISYFRRPAQVPQAAAMPARCQLGVFGSQFASASPAGYRMETAA